MSIESMKLDMLLDLIKQDSITNRTDSIPNIREQFPSLSDDELLLLHSMFMSAYEDNETTDAKLVVTAPASFNLRAKTTLTTTRDLIERANSSILITGYSLSDYFNDLIDCIIAKSLQGVFVRFYANNIESQKHFDRLMSYKGNYLRIYNYQPSDDKMSALHAKVVSVDQERTLITSANLSYHGQEGNIELGTLIESSDIARQVSDFFTQLLFSKVFIEV